MRKPNEGKKKIPGFVIHEHSGTKAGFYLRLQYQGTLLNWAVPRGLPAAAGERFPAVRLPDGAPSQALFEGPIARGEYGEGSLSIWDRGSCLVEKHKEARIEIALKGARTEGRFSLARFRPEQRDWAVTRLAEGVSASSGEEKAAAPPGPGRPGEKTARRPRRRPDRRPRRVPAPSAPDQLPPPPRRREGEKRFFGLGRLPRLAVSPLLNLYYDLVNERARRRSLRRQDRPPEDRRDI